MKKQIFFIVLEPNRTGTEIFGIGPNRNRKFWNRTEPEPKILESFHP